MFKSTKLFVHFANFNTPGSRNLLRELDWDIEEYRRDVVGPNAGE